MNVIKAKGLNMTEIRIKKFLSMNELARQINCNVGVISKVESGTVSLRPATAKKICKALEVTFDEIFQIVQ